MTQGKPRRNLERSVGLPGAVFLGLGAMVGSGVYVSLAFGISVAGPMVLLAVVLAGILALCNGLSSAQCAAAHPVSGGTYEYGYRLLHPALGFTAGWMFLCAKSASAAVASLGVAYYLCRLVGWEGQLPVLALAGLSILLLTGLILSGVRRTTLVNACIVAVTLLGLAVFIFFGLAGLASGEASLPAESWWPNEGWQPLFYATALVFVAYTGYGRVATLGEEIKDPVRKIPLAIIATVAVCALLYLGVAIGLLAYGGGFEDWQKDPAVLEKIASDAFPPWTGTVIAVSAATAMLGVLLNLILGLSRVWLAMGRRRDMPPALDRITDGGTPAVAIITAAVVVAAIMLAGGIETAWSFSAFTVLVYYALTNLSALRLPPKHRRYPRFFSWLGLAGCIFLASWVKPVVWLVGLAILGAGLLWRVLYRKWSQQ